MLAKLLDPAGTAGPVPVLAVAGMAGVGKTTLAVEAGHAAMKLGWFGGVLFIDLHGYDEAPVAPGQALDALLRALGVPPEHIPPETEERAGLYRSLLAQVNDPVLVIADNASSEAQVRPLLPGSGRPKVLVTSRHTLAGLGARLMEVTALDDEGATALLDGALRAARPTDDRISGHQDAAERLARACGRLPLALQIVAALLKADQTLTADELTDQLTHERDRPLALQYDDGSGGATMSVTAAFDVSYRRLEESQARVFRLMAVNPGPDASTVTVAIIADLQVTEARKVLAGLARAHLVEAAPGMAVRWKMHDLVRLYAQRLSDDHAEADRQDEARDRLLGYYLGTAAAADDQVWVLPGMTLPDALADPEAARNRRHGFVDKEDTAHYPRPAVPEATVTDTITCRNDALAWLDAERTSLTAAAQTAASTGHDQAAIRLPLSLSGYFQLRWRVDEWLATAHISVTAARRLGDRRWQAFALKNLGNALVSARRSDEAVTAYQEAIVMFREIGDQDGQGGALNTLSGALLEAGRLDEAITAARDAAEIFRSTGLRYGQAGALLMLGGALQGAGQLEKAITAFQDAAEIYETLGEKYNQGVALGDLGRALCRASRPEEAITTCQEALEIYREARDRHGEGAALTDLGTALLQAGQPEEATKAYQDAVAIFRDTGDEYAVGEALEGFRTAHATRRA